MEANYSPFSKHINELVVDDLAALRTVHEGWYVEYKETVPNPQAIAKSVSAFANTYGGFLFYGIREKSKQENVAGDFPGIASDDVEAMRERIRQAICAHSAPEPHFHIEVFSGPSEALGLTDDRSIICIHVPQSSKAPHIHKSGVIYRRVADSSEPTAENDRHVLGELFKRSNKLLETYKSWYEADPEFNETEKNHPYLRLLVTFDPWRERLPWLDVTPSEIRKLFNPEEKTATLPFDTIHSMRGGFIARQVTNNQLDSLSLTWVLRRDLTSEILIPIAHAHADANEDQQIDLAGYEQEARFSNMLKQRKYSSLMVLDLNQLYPIFDGIFETLDRIALAANWKNGMSATFKILNSDRSCPFIDLDHVMERYEKYGIPISLNFMSALREHHHPDNFIKFHHQDEDGNKLPKEVHAAILMMSVASNLGIPMWEDLTDANPDLDLFGKLRQAGQRSMNAQAIRNRKG